MTEVYHKRLKKRRSPYLLKVLFFILFILGLLFVIRFFLNEGTIQNSFTGEGVNPARDETLANSFASNLCVVDDNIIGGNISVDAKSAMLCSPTKIDTLYAKNAFKKIYPASITKIMTALVVLDNVNIKNKVVISKIVNDIENDSSKANIKPNDELTVEQLLYALMLPSGGDAALALAEYTAGDVGKFCKMMNEKALSLGATKTHFVNPHGLNDKKHYTTAYDMYLIFNAAIKNDDFVRIISTPTYLCNYKKANGNQGQLVFNNTNLYLTGNAKLPKGLMMIGGKTGFTNEAGRCLILLTKDGNNSYISSIFKAKDVDSLYKQMNKLFSIVR